jgi:hypothetical protein
MSHVKSGRKWICGRTEVITSREVSERKKETVSKYMKGRNRQEKRKQPRKKEESGDSEQLRKIPSSHLNSAQVFSPGGF